MAASAVEVHHRIPRCLLGFFDRATSGELDGAGLQAWFDWEEEAFRFRVNPDVSRGELVALIESSALEISEEQHKASHIAAGDFARWGRRGGVRALALYGRGWYMLLANRRWKQITAEQLAESFVLLRRGRS
jgi:hypothetical protein